MASESRRGRSREELAGNAHLRGATPPGKARETAGTIHPSRRLSEATVFTTRRDGEPCPGRKLPGGDTGLILEYRNPDLENQEASSAFFAAVRPPAEDE